MIFRKKQKNKRWQKRPQLYKGKFYYFKKLGQFVLVIISLFGLMGIYFYFQESDILYIKSLDVVTQNEHLTKKQIMALSEITPQDKLFSLDLSKVADNILRFPWVDSVQIRREFPNKIQISVTEKEPILYIQIDNFYFIDAKGKIFKKKEKHENASLPVITGFEKSFVQNHPRLAKVHLDRVLEFYKKVRETHFYKRNQIAQIDYDLIQGITVLTHDDRLEIFYGTTDLMTKHNKLETFAKEKKYKSSLFVRLDLDVNNKIIARKKL